MTLVALPSTQISVLQLPARGLGERAEDVVMIHGLAANMGFWYAGAAQWFTHFGRITLYDLPGHGHSGMPASGYSPRQMANDLGQLLDCLGTGPVHLVAHSFGGMVALTFALLQPERVKSLVLAEVRVWPADPPSWRTVPPIWLQQMRDLGLPLDETRMDPSFQTLVELARLHLERPEAGRTAAAALTDGRGLFNGHRTARRWLELIETTRAYAEMTSGDAFELGDLPRIGQPMLAVFGQNSLLKRSARALRRLCPDCKVEIVPRAGHFFPATRPRLFAALALDFLETTANPAAVRKHRPRRRFRHRGHAGDSGFRSPAAGQGS